MNEQAEARRKLNIWLPMLFSVVLVAGIYIGTTMRHNPPTVAAINVPRKEKLPPGGLGQGKLEELIRYIEARYVDDVNKDILVKEAIDKILQQLDPHSNYISAEQLREVNDQLEGNFDGIGIEFLVVDDTVMVINTLPSGPAEEAGILAGDKIVSVEDSLVLGENADYEKLLSKLKGERGSDINVGIKRLGQPELLAFTLTRDKIPVKSIEVAYMLDEKTGYLKINRFSSNTYEEFLAEIKHMVENKGMEHLVIDLRQNGGGYLQEATNILSQLFQDKDKLLVYTEGENVPRNDYKTSGRYHYELNNIGVLVDEGSASASEILAGAIQDWDRGVIIGRRTFGKGLVQEQYGLRDGSAIRLTVARYYTPSGRCIQKPYEGDRDEYDLDVAERISNGELYDESKVNLIDTTKFFTEAGRVVYGGGGIVPDFFVPLDSNFLDPDFIELTQLVPSYAFRYLEKNRKEWVSGNLDEMVNNFKVDESMMNELYSLAEKEGEQKIDRLPWKLEKEVKLRLKATVARQLWSELGYARVINDTDPAVQKAMELMKEKEPLSLK